jgi:hypothetical protein
LSTGRTLLGIGALVLGLAAIALAHDIHAWDGGIDRGDARFASKPAAARWSASTWLPGDPALAALEMKDDLAVRNGEKAFAVAVATPVGYDEGREKAKLRGLAELALSDALATGSRAQASRAGNLLGILGATDDSEADASVTDRRAAETFEAAVRADPANEDGKYNLELLLRRSKVVGSREGAGGSSGDFGDSLPGAGAGLPGSGY